MSIKYKTTEYTQHRLLHHKPSHATSTQLIIVQDVGFFRCSVSVLLDTIKCSDFSTVRLNVRTIIYTCTVPADSVALTLWISKWSKYDWHSLHLKHGGWIEMGRTLQTLNLINGQMIVRLALGKLCSLLHTTNEDFFLVMKSTVCCMLMCPRLCNYNNQCKDCIICHFLGKG